MSNNNLPTGWGNQPTNAPKGWGKTPEQKKKNPFAPVAAKEDNKNKESEPIAEQSDNIINDDTDNIVPSEQETDAAGYNDSFDISVSQKESEKEDESEPQTQTTEKKPKTIRASTVVLVILLTAALCFLAVFAFLFFRQSGNERVAEEQHPVETTATLAPTELATQVFTEEPTSTEPPTVKETAEPTTVEKATESENNDDSKSDFESYLVDVINEVYYYEKPDYTSKITGQFTELTTYTVVDETYDETGTHWGKLKSGAGWFNITEATDEYYNQRLSAARRSFMQAPDTKFEMVGDVAFSYYPIFPVDQHTPVEDGYYKRIDSLSVEYVGDRTYTLHIKGEYQNYNDAPMHLCCTDIDNCFHALNTYSIGEPFLNEKFEFDASIRISNNTSMVHIDFNFV